MSPRPYALGKRAAAVEAIQERILQSIVALHAQRGIAATSAVDVAAHADVSVSTVTRYFPSLEAMVRACGGHLMHIAPPPRVDIFESQQTLDARIGVLLAAWFTYYERRAPWLASAYRDARAIAPLKESLAQQERERKSHVREALKGAPLPEKFFQTASALSSFQSWEAMRSTGLTSADATNVVAEMLFTWLRHSLPNN